jgi:hypothetical protein
MSADMDDCYKSLVSRKHGSSGELTPCIRGDIIPEHFEPGPGPARARSAHEPYWTGVGRDLEARDFFLPEPDPKCCV